MSERIIVSLTTWSKRIQNIPTVLNTIFAQTVPPDLVVLNLAYEEQVPSNVQRYLENHSVEVNRVPDTKVYKKIIPTLKKYPNDCIISIDDDWLYPRGMIADFVEVHRRYPNNPVSGNRMISEYLNCQCHCGCASLIKASFLGNFIDTIDDKLMQNCPSDDLVYTYFATKAGFPYVRTQEEYYINMEPYNDTVAYSEGNESYIEKTNYYLICQFGQIENNFFLGYIKDKYIADLVNEINKKQIENKRRIINSNTYKFSLKLQKLIRLFR